MCWQLIWYTTQTINALYLGTIISNSHNLLKLKNWDDKFLISSPVCEIYKIWRRVVLEKKQQIVYSA